MKSNRRTKSINLSNSRWLAYATAGIASGFGLGSAAEGEIHYSGLVNVKMEGQNNFSFSTTTLPLSGGAALLFAHYHATYTDGFFRIVGAESASARVYKSRGEVHRSFLTNVKHGSQVSTGLFGPANFVYIRSTYQKSYFGTGHGGFIGFRFNTGRGTQYGWARMEVQGVPRDSFFYIVKDYGWGDPGDPVAAGQHKSFDQKVSAMPEAGSLGLLAIGAAGLEAWRSARAQAPTGN